MPTPLKQKYVKRFLGHVGYYRRFIKYFSKLVSTMFSLFSKYIGFCLTPKCQNEFKNIKEKLIATPDLQGPNWTLSFHIHTDASNKEIGEVLGKNEYKKPYAIYFTRKNLSGAELNYIVTEKELLVVVHVLNKF